MIQDLQAKNKRIAVLGLGYVGLPLALEFAKKYSVIGFDINSDRIELMKKHIDPSEELEQDAFDGTDIEFTSNPEDLKKAHFYIVAVPTPIDNHNIPNLRPLLSATELVGKALKKGDIVVYESTVYPGATEEDCLPILQDLSRLKLGIDFKLGYSPERINPGDKVYTLTNILKIVSGSDNDALGVIADLYGSIITKGIHKASSIKVAEAAKIIENTQRDVNIALMNELSMIFKKMNINTYEVLDAAATKWNFYKVTPGLVGGHCIGVDPYYLTYKAIQLKHHAQIITSGRSINDNMPIYLAKNILKDINNAGKVLKHSRVLIMGATFKENVSDIRNSKIFDTVTELESFGIQVDVIDPHACANEVLREYNCRLAEKPEGKYDVIMVAVKHKEYENLSEEYFASISADPFILYDIKGIYRNSFPKARYFSF
ncbi:MAG TPA: nucleotide sugar dehydrogenase [Bacteroidales bacterium]|nr:MAG: UDP-N-acetyl-D-glucosamine 6-dehydrogenase [Bacteroidetes bacterium ADurb.Bin217]HPM13106.1 nucleotide sugar dehydrogenase [Bacteroidales bacterium]